jgi:kinesin family protein 5
VFLLAVDALDLPFLNAYLDSLGLPNFKKGCNFAAAGSTILPATASSICPFSFGIQVSQFLRFKARALELLAAKGIYYYSLICFVKQFVTTMIVR